MKTVDLKRRRRPSHPPFRRTAAKTSRVIEAKAGNFLRCGS
jgi:hypothetical protein